MQCYYTPLIHAIPISMDPHQVTNLEVVKFAFALEMARLARSLVADLQCAT